MTTISKADKRRLTIPSIEDGRRYLVKQEPDGWWVEPEPEIKPNRHGQWNAPNVIWLII